MSNKQTSIKKNFIMNVILTLSSVIFPLITFRYVAEILLPEGTGKVQFAISTVAYFNMFAQLGIPTYGVRAIAKVRDNPEDLTRTAQELLIINLVMSVFAYIALFIAILTVPKFRDEKVLYFIISSTILLSAIGMEWMYKGLEKYTYITIRSIVFKCIAMLAMFALVHERKDYVIYGGISVFAASASNILNFINAKKYISLKPVGNYDFSKHFRAVGIFFAMACATTAYTNLDSVMLGFMTNDTEVGLYNAAVKVKTVLVSVVTSLGAVLLPRASYYVEHNQEEEFRRISRKALNFVFAVSLPLTVFFILFAKESILLLSGKSFEGSVLPMQVIMPTLIFIGITNIIGIQILVPRGRERTVLLSEIVGAVTDLIINALLIPTLGSVGAAIGTLIAEFAVLIIQFSSVKTEMSAVFKEIQYWKIILSCVCAFVICYFTVYYMGGVFYKLVVSACLFFGTYGLLMYLLKEPIMREIVSVILKKL